MRLRVKAFRASGSARALAEIGYDTQRRYLKWVDYLQLLKMLPKEKSAKCHQIRRGFNMIY